MSDTKRHSEELQRKRRGSLVQWYSGYSESLTDCHHGGNRICVGVMLTDWM